MVNSKPLSFSIPQMLTMELCIGQLQDLGMVCVSLSRPVAPGLGTTETLIRAACQPTNYVYIISFFKHKPDNSTLAHQTGKRVCLMEKSDHWIAVLRGFCWVFSNICKYVEWPQLTAVVTIWNLPFFLTNSLLLETSILLYIFRSTWKENISMHWSRAISRHPKHLHAVLI